MAKPKQSGHSRLKAALVLRDALAVELKIPLQHALTALMNVEKELGVERALHEGKYPDAVCSLCSSDAGLLIQLDSQIRDACIKARLAPRYAQYMALLFFAGWLYAKQTDESGFIERLNLYLAEHPSKLEQLPAFTVPTCNMPRSGWQRRREKPMCSMPALPCWRDSGHGTGSSSLPPVSR